MTAVIQRVLSADVKVEGQSVGSIEKGLLILLGVEKGDGEQDADALAAKLSKIRIFEDENGKMNLSLADVGGEILVISNFTLCADCRHGNRPDYFGAEAPARADELYCYFTDKIRELSSAKTEKGVFGADMKVSLVNDGPVTLVVKSSELTKKKEKQ